MLALHVGIHGSKFKQKKKILKKCATKTRIKWTLSAMNCDGNGALENIAKFYKIVKMQSVYND